MDWYLFSETGVCISRSLSSKRPSERGSIYCWGEFCAITSFIKLPGNLKFSSVFIDWSLLGSRSNLSGWLIINSLSYWFFFSQLLVGFNKYHHIVCISMVEKLKLVDLWNRNKREPSVVWVNKFTLTCLFISSANTCRMFNCAVSRRSVFFLPSVSNYSFKKWTRYTYVRMSL